MADPNSTNSANPTSSNPNSGVVKQDYNKLPENPDKDGLKISEGDFLSGAISVPSKTQTQDSASSFSTTTPASIPTPLPAPIPTPTVVAPVIPQQISPQTPQPAVIPAPVPVVAPTPSPTPSPAPAPISAKIDAYADPIPTNHPAPYITPPAPVPVIPATLNNIPYSAINPQTIINNPVQLPPQPQYVQPQQPQQPLDPYAGLGNDNFDQVGYDPGFGLNYGAESFDENSGFSRASQIAKGSATGLGKFFKYQWKLLLAFATIITLLALSWNLITTQFLPQGSLGDLGNYDNVKASIEAPASLPQGLPGTWVITISNQELVPINQLRLELDFDSDFQYISSIDKADNPQGNVYTISRLDAVGRGTSSTKITLTGTLNGTLDKDTVMSGVVKYVPDPLLGAVRGQRQIGVAGAKTRIASSEVKISLTPTEQLVSTGEQVEFTVVIRNSRETDFTDLQLRMIYPGGDAFRYDSSEYVAGNFTEPKKQPDNGDNIWNIPRLAGRAEHTLKVRGRVTGADTARLTFGTELSTRTDGVNFKPIATTFKDVTISAQPLVLKTFVNNAENLLFEAGRSLTFSVSYENQGREVLRNVEIFGYVEDEADLLDFNSLRFVGGERGGLNNERVQWRGGNTPQLVNLAPGAKGELKYTIDIKKDAEFYRGFEEQEKYVISPKADARASNLQNFVVSGPIYKAVSRLGFDQPKVVQLPTPATFKENERLFLVSWALNSTQNKVDNVKVTSFTSLQPTAWNQNSVNPPAMADRINYNQFNGQITWDVGRVEPYSGNNRETVVVSFELKVEFTGNQSVKILTAPNIVGTDNFTGQNFNITGADISVQRERNQ